jgi:hypothetical protein
MEIRHSKRGGARPGAGRPKKADVVPPPSGEMSHREATRRKEAALAQLREAELAQKRGDLVERKRVESALVGIAAQVRANFERLPDKLAEQLGASDADGCHRLLTAELDAVLVDLAGQLDRMA